MVHAPETIFHRLLVRFATVDPATNRSPADGKLGDGPRAAVEAFVAFCEAELARCGVATTRYDAAGLLARFVDGSEALLSPAPSAGTMAPAPAIGVMGFYSQGAYPDPHAVGVTAPLAPTGQPVPGRFPKIDAAIPWRQDS
jgi:hypothetical protein